MTVMHFDTGVLPPRERLARFAAASSSYRIEALGDPDDFEARCSAWRLGDVNVMRARISPVRYHRPAEQIDVDGEDRLVVFHHVAGRSHGTLDGRRIRIGAGEAMIWDLTRPLDIRTTTGIDVEVVTLPRFLVEEVLPGATMCGLLGASPALALLVAHLRFLLCWAGNLPEETRAFQGRALRDMVVAAHYPTALAHTRDEHAVPLMQRLFECIDHAPAAAWTVPMIAVSLGSTPALIEALLDRFGGMDALLERRRLLAAYRMLCNTTESASISVIAARCGFTNMPRFSRRFHATFRTSARDLRVHHRADLPEWAGGHHLDRAFAALMTA